MTAAASQAAERAGIPFVNAGSSQPALTQRGLKYFFRTSPTDETFSQLMFELLKEFGAKSGQKFQSVSIIHEDTAYGTDSAKVQERIAKEQGIKVLQKIAYKAQTPSAELVPYRTVKFDANGHNELVRPILMQVQKGKYCTIYPFELASCPVLSPTPSWADKAKM